MSRSLHLSESLSQTLIAFTIEYDNEWEKSFWLPSKAKPLRVSMVMWENFMRFVVKGDISLQELSKRAGYPKGRAHPCIAGMLRWGFVTATPGGRGKTSKLDQIIRPTKVGRQAGEFWAPLASEIEGRWGSRFGAERIHELKEALADLVARFDSPMPRYLPVLGHLDGMRMPIASDPDHEPPQGLRLPHLLSKVIQRYAVSFEEESTVSLTHRANVLRVLSSEGIPVRAVPPLAGISKEAMKMAYGFLMKSGHVLEEPVPSGRGKSLRLTDEGMKERGRYHKLQQTMEARWEREFSHGAISRVRSSLDAILKHDVGAELPLFLGLTPPPKSWRSELPKPCVLPHQPMVLHRGGWPDGS